MKNNDVLAAMLAAAMLNGIENDKKKPTSDETAVDFRKQAKEIGEALMQAHLGYMDAGFNEKQAFQLMMNAITK